MRMIDADALIHELNNSHYPGAPYVDAGISIAIGKVCDAPTIEPKKGKWIPQDHNKKNGMITTTVYYCPTCSVCGETGGYDMSFCPNCGADMRGESE